MKYGTINCTCNQQFYFESGANNITCIKCDKAHDISEYPELIEVEPQDIETLDASSIPE